MKIEWLGNSTFLISTYTGKKVLIDPFNILSLTQYDIAADYITFSKEKNIHYDNSSNLILCNGENYCDNNMRITSFLSNGDDVNSLKRGPNYIYTYEFDNLKICHLGYLGEILNDDYIDKLKDMDVLFLPIGGNYCINGRDASTLASKLAAKYVIPMCYRCSIDQFYFGGPKDFLKGTKNIVSLNKPYIYYSDLNGNKDSTTLFFSSYKRDCKYVI